MFLLSAQTAEQLHREEAWAGLGFTAVALGWK